MKAGKQTRQQIRRSDGPSNHAGRPAAPKKAGFMRNRTRPTTKSYPFLPPKKQTKATGNDGGDFPCAEKNGGKNRPVGTISREVMRLTTVLNYIHMNDTVLQEQKRKYSPGDHIPNRMPGPRETRRKSTLRKEQQGKGEL